jgi:MoxR-like ATPase
MHPTAEEIRLLGDQVAHASRFTQRIQDALGQVIVGQHLMVERLLIGLLCDGHVLLEGVPGLAKTLAIKSLAQTVQADFSRIQFTPDLLPADVTGTLIYNQPKNEFVVRKGPIFANFVLADEINRAPAKVQSALLEAMQERQVTIGDSSYPLPQPFLVLATQNPIEQEGTYPLPEAQVDRFLLKVVITYPSKQEEQLILRQYSSGAPAPALQPVASLQELIDGKKLVRQIYLDEQVERYIVDLVHATRFPEQYHLARLKPLLQFGASPRATLSLALAAKAMAFLQQRAYVIPEDVRAIAHDVLRHRIGLSYEAEAENMRADDLIAELLKAVPAP